MVKKGYPVRGKSGVLTEFPSVTTILAAAFPSPFNPRNSQNRRNRKDWLERGVATHQAIQEKLEGRNPKLTLAYSAYYYAALPYLEKIENIALIERSVWHAEHQFAGTPDLIAKIDEKWVLIDWKTSQKPRTRIQMARNFCQAAAYVGASNWLFGWKIDEARVINLLPNEENQMWRIEGKELVNSWVKFLQANKEYQRALKLVK